MLNKFKGLFALLLVVASIDIFASTVVSISVLENGDVRQSGVAALVADETLIINQMLVSQGDQIQVLDIQSGATLIGDVVHKSEDADLALVIVKGLEGVPYKLSMQPLDIGRKVSLAVMDEFLIVGVTHSVLPISDKDSYPRVQHTALIRDGEFGAPLLNNCGELVGISQSRRKSVFDSRLVTESSFGVASDLSTVKSFLSAQDVAFELASEICLSEEEKLLKLEEQKRESDAELSEIAQENAAKSEALEQLNKEKEEQEEELKKLEEELQSQKDLLTQTEDEAVQTNEELARASEEVDKKSEELDRVEEEINVLEETVTKTIETAGKERLYIGIGSGAVVIIVAGIAFFMLRRRRQQLIEAGDKADAQLHEISVEKSKFEAAQEELSKATASFSDIVYVIVDGEKDTEERVKISGDAIARSAEGVVVGRGAQMAYYVINDPEISRQHLRISLVNDEVFIEDLGSANGTFVNNTQLVSGDKRTISSGDTLRLGRKSGKIYFLDQAE